MSKIGIPRAGHYFEQGDLWQELISKLGFKVQVSPVTDQGILDRGQKALANEFCLPVKVYFGHLLELAADEKVDRILVPYFMISKQAEWHHQYCPNWLGLPDLIKTVLPADKTVVLKYDPYDLERLPLINEQAPRSAIWQQAIQVAKTEEEQKSAELKKNSVGLVGHPYLLEDPFLNGDIVKQIKKAGFATCDTNHLTNMQQLTGYQQHWESANRETRSLRYLAKQPEIKAIIRLTPFNCGCTFLVNDLVIKKIRQETDKPILDLVLDENLSDTHLSTRLEAFFDLIH